MAEESELAQESRSILPEYGLIPARDGCVELITRDGLVRLITRDGCVVTAKLSTPPDGRVTEIENTLSESSEINRFKFKRFLDESFPYLEEPQLEALCNACLDARHSEEFLLCYFVTDQLVRTVVGHENLCSNTWIQADDRCKLMSDTNMLRAVIRDEASMRVHLPSFMLKEAFEEGKSLKSKLFEWRCIGKCCGMETPLENELEGLDEIGLRGSVESASGLEGPEESTGLGESEENGPRGSKDENHKQPRSSKLFWEIPDADVKHLKNLHEGGADGVITLIEWRGREFVKKESQLDTNAELKVVKWFSHPHIVYSFGEPSHPQVFGDPSVLCSYFMEYMPSNLSHVIRERVNRENVPPLSQHESVDVLLQIAEAMRYIHEENVVHCDLKCDNILASEVSTSDSASSVISIVKVTDFGSARLLGNSRKFTPGNGTTRYIPPEVFLWRKDNTFNFGEPKKIDVYSFGIVAFEILTGESEYSELIKRPTEFKAGVIDGSVRPRLREECQREKKLIQNNKLISLIESCWLKDPSQRPTFVKICEELNDVMQDVKKSEQMLQSNSPYQANPVSGTSSAPEGHAFCLEVLSVVWSCISRLWQ